MTATPPQGIDRESARAHVLARIDRIPDSDSALIAKDILRALVRPAEGVTLTPEEAAYVRRWLPTANSQRARDLAARLEAAQ